MSGKGRITIKMQKGANGTKIARYPVVVKRTASTPQQASKLMETRARLYMQIYFDQNGQPRK